MKRARGGVSVRGRASFMLNVTSASAKSALLSLVFAVSSYLEVCYDYGGVTYNTCLRYIFSMEVR